MANPLEQLTEDQRDIAGENPLRRVYIYGDDQRPEAADEVPYADNYLTQRVAPQPGANLVQDVLALVRQAQEYLTPKYESTGGQRSRSPIVNEVFDTLTTDRPGKPRLQLWPERMVRSGLTLPGDVMSGRVPVTDPETGRTSSELIERAQDTAGLAVPGALLQRPGSATLGSGPVRFAVKPPKVLYRGIVEGAQESGASGLGTSHLGKGLYTSKDKSMAKKYATKGDIREFSPEDAFPQNPLVLNGAGGAGNLMMDYIFRNSEFKNAREFHKAYPDLGDWVREKGFDGVVANGGEEVVKYPRSLFSDSGTPGSGIAAVANSGKPVPVFYSALEHAATNAVQDTMSPQQWLGWLKNQPGVKGEELAWTGLGDWLGAQKGKVSKADVQRYLDEHKVEIKDVTKRSDQTTGLDSGRFTIEENPRGGGYRVIDNDQSAVVDTFQTRPEAEQALMGYRNDPNFKDVYSDTKYSGYQLPGGENYREHLLTLPQKEQRAFDKLNAAEKNDLRNQYEKEFGEGSLESERDLREFYDQYLAKDRGASKSADYRSSHWDEPNVLAHVRTNDRDVGGVPSLHIEEIQSDWHQEGRRQGYKSDIKPEEIEAANSAYKIASEKLDNLSDQGLDYRKIGNIKSQLFTEAMGGDTAQIKLLTDQVGRIYGPEAEKLAKNYVDATIERQRVGKANDSKIPDAPFKTSWAELALKRMVRMAAEEGKTRVSWTPGEAQAARYDLSKQLKELQYLKHDDGTYEIAGVTKDGGGFNHPERVKADKLSDIVGKEMAEKIVRNEGRRNRGQPANGGYFEGVDLKVGGEGMRGFYDNMLPKMVEKLGKAHGVKVKKDLVPVKEINRTVDDRFSVTGDKRIFNTVEEAKKAASEPVYYFDIPPAWSDQAVSKGFPLFMSGIPFPLTPVDFDPFKKDR